MTAIQQAIGVSYLPIFTSSKFQNEIARKTARKIVQNMTYLSRPQLRFRASYAAHTTALRTSKIIGFVSMIQLVPPTGAAQWY
jgi:hypothetical protein